MRSATLAAVAISVAFSAAAPAERTAASEFAERPAHRRCDCARDWPHRHYWQWGHRPLWDDPWLILEPNFFGSPQPHLVPADIWARKWHPPWPHHWRAYHGRRDF